MERNIVRKSKCHEMVLTSRNPWYSTERDINHQITGGVSNDITVDVNDPDNVNLLIYSIRRKELPEILFNVCHKLVRTEKRKTARKLLRKYRAIV
jgi:hypothetical protein